MASIRLKKFYFCSGELAEWSNAVVLKTIDPSRGPGVRIPHSPQKETHNISCGFLFFRCTKFIWLSMKNKKPKSSSEDWVSMIVPELPF